jgi:hypothetical protein
MFNTSLVFAQTNFSGTWILDNSKSDAMYRDYKITYSIKQTPQNISLERVYGSPDKTTSAGSNPQIYTLDGKVTSKEEEGGINKSWTKWSADKKVLTISDTRTVGSEVYGSNATHKLSADGSVLTVEVTNARPEDKKVILEVYKKK